MSGYDQNSISIQMPTVTGSASGMAFPVTISPSEAMSSALMSVSGLTGETITVQTSPNSVNGAPANPIIYRTDWQGTQLLYSTARTNRLLQSQDLTSPTWIKIAAGTGTVPIVTGNFAVAPDGTTTACRLQCNRGAGNSAGDYSLVAQGVAAHDGIQAFTTYIWLKSNTGSPQLVFFGNDAASISLLGVITVTTEWQRFSVSGPLFATPFQFGSYGQYSTSLNSIDILAWGGDDKSGSTPTPYIPTTTVPVTVTDYTQVGNTITFAETPVSGAILSFGAPNLADLKTFGFGDGITNSFLLEYGAWGALTSNSGKSNGVFQIDLRGASAYRLVKSGSTETATVNMTLKRDALQYKNVAGTWTVT